MGNENRDYWVNLVEKLNTNNDLNNLLPEILKDLCAFFDFGGGFIYQREHTGDFVLFTDYLLYAGAPLPERLDLSGELGPALYDQLKLSRDVSYHYGGGYSPLGEKLASLFGAGALMLTPVPDKQGELIAMVGILDRRSKVRHKQEDLDFAYSVLNTLGTYIKMQLLQQRVERTHKALDSILNHMGIDVYVNDFNTHEVLYANESMAAPYGGVDKVIGGTCWQEWYDGKTEACDFCPQKKLIDEEGNPTKVYSWDYKRPFDSSWFRVFSAAFQWVDGRLAHVVSSVDITENKNNELIVRRLAEYDHLTGLPNRYLLTQTMEEGVAQTGEGGREAYVLFFDLDGFKQVNDTLGHKVGDELLKAIGARLQAAELFRDKTYRYGGDEFVVLCAEADLPLVQRKMDFLLDLFSRPWQLDEHEVRCGVSIGVSHYPYDDDTAAGLLRKADMAMYAAKTDGKMRACFYNRGNICLPSAYQMQ